jgi:hypothetical protein
MIIKIYPANLAEKFKKTFHLDFIEQCLNKTGSFLSDTEGDVRYVTHDKYVQEAYSNNFCYPNNLANKLADKFELQRVMADSGFNTLRSEIITDVNNITLENFIVKFRFSSGKVGVTKDGLPIHNLFNGVSFKDKEQLKAHPLFKESLFADGNFIAQEDAGIREHTLATVAATANSNSELLFLRNTTDKWKFLDRTSTTLAFNIYPDLNTKIQEFFTNNKIKNVAVTVQFVVKNDEYYIIDWNFRFGINMGKEMLARNPEEFERAVVNLVSNQTPVQFNNTDVWVTNFD